VSSILLQSWDKRKAKVAVTARCWNVACKNILCSGRQCVLLRLDIHVSSYQLITHIMEDHKTKFVDHLCTELQFDNYIFHARGKTAALLTVLFTVHFGLGSVM